MHGVYSNPKNPKNLKDLKDPKDLTSWPLRLVVRTSGFHPDNRGSIPLGVTNYYSM